MFDAILWKLNNNLRRRVSAYAGSLATLGRQTVVQMMLQQVRRRLGRRWQVVVSPEDRWSKSRERVGGVGAEMVDGTGRRGGGRGVRSEEEEGGGKSPMAVARALQAVVICPCRVHGLLDRTH